MALAASMIPTAYCCLRNPSHAFFSKERQKLLMLLLLLLRAFDLRFTCATL
jgi:hypothetical protein